MILPLKCSKCGNEMELYNDDSQLIDEESIMEMEKAFKELGIVNIQDEEKNT